MGNREKDLQQVQAYFAGENQPLLDLINQYRQELYFWLYRFVQMPDEITAVSINAFRRTVIALHKTSKSKKPVNFKTMLFYQAYRLCKKFPLHQYDWSQNLTQSQSLVVQLSIRHEFDLAETGFILHRNSESVKNLLDLALDSFSGDENEKNASDQLNCSVLVEQEPKKPNAEFWHGFEEKVLEACDRNKDKLKQIHELRKKIMISGAATIALISLLYHLTPYFRASDIDGFAFQSQWKKPANVGPWIDVLKTHHNSVQFANKQASYAYIGSLFAKSSAFANAQQYTKSEKYFMELLKHVDPSKDLLLLGNEIVLDLKVKKYQIDRWKKFLSLLTEPLNEESHLFFDTGYWLTNIRLTSAINDKKLIRQHRKILLDKFNRFYHHMVVSAAPALLIKKMNHVLENLNTKDIDTKNLNQSIREFEIYLL